MKTDVTVREVMDREYLGVSESDDLVDTVELMLRDDADVAVVLRGRTPVGIVTARGVMALVVDGPEPASATVEDVMTRTFHAVRPNEPVQRAADLMSAQSARRLVVTEGNGSEPLGIVSESDLVATRAYDSREDVSAESAAAGTVETGVGSALATEAETEAEDTFEEQSICEVCGTFAQELASFNGQLLCDDCRDM